MKKHSLYIIFGVILMTCACSFESGTPAVPAQPPVDEVGTMVASTRQAVTAQMLTAARMQPPTVEIATLGNEIPVTFQAVSQKISFVIPKGLAGGAEPDVVWGLGDAYSSWERYPTHVEFVLVGYPHYRRFIPPEITVYPAEEYAYINHSGEEQIERVKQILAGTTPTSETLPRVPFSPFTVLINARIEIVPFQNGSGVRTVMQEGAGQINNEDLFYHFQGLTDDGEYYVVVSLPITAPILPATNDLSLPAPEGGVPFNTSYRSDNSYYSSVTEKLNALSPDDYNPSLNTLDALIQSILVTNPY